MSASTLASRASAFASVRISSSDRRRQSRASRAVVVVNAGGKPDEYYVGKGKYIKDDGRGLLAKTGRDNLTVGGFAGGEVGLQAYRAELNAQNAAKALEKAKKPRRETKEVNLQKDFGVLAGGFPGGEKGLKIYNKTGEIPQTKPATLGWGPPVLALVTVLTGYTYLSTGELSQEAIVSTVQSLSTKAGEIDTQAVSSGATGAVGAVAGVVGQAVDLLPEDVKHVGSEAAQAALAVLVGGVVLKVAAGKIVDAIGSSFKVVALAVVSGSIALKILNIL